MKADLPDMPVRPPAKRRQLENVPDVWLARWLDSDDLTPSDRRRVEEVKKSRRKQIRDLRVGLLVGEEGVTPSQLDALRDVLGGMGATEIHHPGVSPRVHQTCKAIGVPVAVHWGESLEAVVRSSDAVVGVPKEFYEPETKVGVWAAVRYARHRSLPARVIMPNGEEL